MVAIGVDSAVQILSSSPASAAPAALIRNVNKVYFVPENAPRSPGDTRHNDEAKKSLKVIYCHFE